MSQKRQEAQGVFRRNDGAGWTRSLPQTPDPAAQKAVTYFTDPVRPPRSRVADAPSTVRVHLLRLPMHAAQHQAPRGPNPTGLARNIRVDPLAFITLEHADLQASTASNSLQLGSERGSLAGIGNGPIAVDQKTHTRWLTLTTRRQGGRLAPVTERF